MTLKRINPRAVDDAVELTLLSNNPRLASHPDLANNLQAILPQLNNYHASNGNPWSLTALNIPENLKAALKSHYNHPPKDRLKYLEEIRDNLSPEVCPMCGGFGSGTLDHVLPKEAYAEFAIYSRNLVPACQCNNKKRTACKGGSPAERVIHPYYDVFLDESLYKASFIGDLKTPTIKVIVCNPAHEYSGVLEFHLREVILKNKIINWMIKTWSNLCLRGYEMLDAFLPAKELNADNLQAVLESYNRSKISEYGTPNNWWSIFLIGLIEDNERLTYLANVINELRN